MSDIRLVEVERRRGRLRVERQDGEDGLDRPGGAEEVAHGALGARDSKGAARGVLPEHIDNRRHLRVTTKDQIRTSNLPRASASADWQRRARGRAVHLCPVAVGCRRGMRVDVPNVILLKPALHQ